MSCYVYRYWCPIRHQCIYVGKGRKGRYRSHLKRTDVHPLTHYISWIRKHGLEPTIDFICKDVDEELANLVEMEAITKYGRRDLGTGTLCNLTLGGEGTKGFKHSEEECLRRRKLPQALLEAVRNPSDETRQLLGYLKGKKLSTQAQLDGAARSSATRKAMHAAGLIRYRPGGYKLTEEQRAKLRVPKKGWTEDARKIRMAALNTPECKAKRAASAREAGNRPETRAKNSEAQKAAHARKREEKKLLLVFLIVLCQR